MYWRRVILIVASAHASVTPYKVDATPDGGYVIADAGNSSLQGSEPRIRRITPDGRIHTIAGTGRYALTPPTGDERRGDGAPAPAADLLSVGDLAVLADGGVVFVENTHWDGYGDPTAALLRYVAPDRPGLLAVALRRDVHRIFDPPPRPRSRCGSPLPPPRRSSCSPAARPLGRSRSTYPPVSH